MIVCGEENSNNLNFWLLKRKKRNQRKKKESQKQVYLFLNYIHIKFRFIHQSTSLPSLFVALSS